MFLNIRTGELQTITLDRKFMTAFAQLLVKYTRPEGHVIRVQQAPDATIDTMTSGNVQLSTGMSASLRFYDTTLRSETTLEYVRDYYVDPILLLDSDMSVSECTGRLHDADSISQCRPEGHTFQCNDCKWSSVRYLDRAGLRQAVSPTNAQAVS